MARIPRTRLLSALAGALAALLVAGCGGGQDESRPAGGTGAGGTDPAAITGTVTWWDTSDASNEAPAFRALVDRFRQRYPKVTVNYVNVPFGEAQNKFKTAAQTGAGAPDVIRAEVAWTPEFAALGYLAPLDGTPALSQPEDFLPTPASSTQYAGKTFAVPQVTDTLALLYNKKLLAEAGVAAPPTTMAELKAAALRVRQRTKANGFYVNADAYFLLPHIYGEGGDLLDVGSKKIVVDSPQAAAGVATVADLISSGAAPKPALTDGYQNMQAGFKDGRIAMIFNGPWSISDDYTGPAFADKANLGIAPIPAGSVTAAAPVGGHNYAIYAGSPNLAASYAFVAFMSSLESQVEITRQIGLLPTRAAAYTRPEVTGNAVVSAFKPVLDKAHARPWIPEGGQLFSPLMVEYAKVLNGSATPAAALAATAREYRRLLKGWG